MRNRLLSPEFTITPYSNPHASQGMSRRRNANTGLAHLCAGAGPDLQHCPNGVVVSRRDVVWNLDLLHTRCSDGPETPQGRSDIGRLESHGLWAKLVRDSAKLGTPRPSRPECKTQPLQRNRRVASGGPSGICRYCHWKTPGSRIRTTT